jgi:hypothetical protein
VRTRDNKFVLARSNSATDALIAEQLALVRASGTHTELVQLRLMEMSFCFFDLQL